MDIILDKILYMNIAAIGLIPAVILVRAVFQKAPKYIRCILWALVAIRLVCPFSIETAFSLVPSIDSIQQQLNEDDNKEQDSQIVQDEQVDEGNVEIIEDSEEQILAEQEEPSVDNERFEEIPDNTDYIDNADIVSINIYSIIWIFGMATILLHSVISYFRLKKRVSTSTNYDDRIWVSDEVETPFILGVLRPRIYLPSGMDGETKKYVLAHEYAHISRRDYIWKPLGFLIVCVHWFNPLVWVAYVLFSRDIEMACDEKVIKNYDVEERKAYSKALLACSASNRTTTECPVAFSEVGVKGRVKSVLNYKKPAFWAIIVALSACIAVAVGFLTDPKDNIDPENAYAVGKDGVVTVDEYVRNYQDYLGDGYLEEEAKRLAQRKSLEFEASYQEALRQGFSVNKKEIKEYIADVKESFTIASNGEEALKSIIWRYGSEEAYYEYLEVACEKSIPVNKYLKDLEQQWLYDLDNDFDTFAEYKNVVVGKLVIKEEFKLANGESANYLIEELATEEPVVTEKNDSDKYAATYKDKISASSINDYEHAIALCEDAVEEFIDAVIYQRFYDFTPYIENEMLIAWIEYRAANHVYTYDMYTEYDVEAQNITWHDNYAVFNVSVSADNYSEGYSYMVVQNLDGVLRITDWYWDDKDSPDETYRGEFDIQFNPTYWEKIAITKSEISTGIRFKITNKYFDITETMQQSDEFLLYMLFQKEWSEGLELKADECDLILEVYDNKIQYNTLAGIFIDTKNNRSLVLNDIQKTALYYLFREYGVVFSVEEDDNYGIKLNVYNVTPTGADIEIIQDSTNFSHAAHTGAEYWLEKLGENGWEECEYVDNNKNRSWVAIAYGIPYKDSINWESLYGTLSPGKYRIGKNVSIRTSKTSINRTLYAEFEIK